MKTLLLKLEGHMTLNRTIFPPFLYVYDDMLIYKRRNWFVVKEITISYNHIGQVRLATGIFFSGLEIDTTASENISIRFVNKQKAAMAKKIIDQKIYHAHAKHQSNINPNESNDVKEYEKTLNRLKELMDRGQISVGEYSKRRDDFLRKMR